MNSEALEHAGASWRDGLTAAHWRVLICSFLGWIFDGFEAFALVQFPLMRSVLTPQRLSTPALYAGTVIGITLLGWGIGGVAKAALTMGTVYLFGLLLPWFMPETKGQSLPG